jgi:hypothetical protein
MLEYSLNSKLINTPISDSVSHNNYHRSYRLHTTTGKKRDRQTDMNTSTRRSSLTSDREERLKILAGRMWTAGRWSRNVLYLIRVYTQPSKWLVKIKCLSGKSTRICFPGNRNDVISHLTPLTDECRGCSQFRYELQSFPDMTFQELVAVLNISITAKQKPNSPDGSSVQRNKFPKQTFSNCVP